MTNKEIQTRLVKKFSRSARVCTSCDNEITIGEMYHIEEGVDEHLHSLLARNFCSDCYAKYGQQSLLKSNTKK